MSIIDSIQSQLTGETISKAAAHLGESESGVAKAINGLLPTVLNTIFTKAGTHEGAASMLSTTRNVYKSGIAKDLPALFSGAEGIIGKGADLAKNLIGNKSTMISKAVAHYSGIHAPSVVTLLGMVTPTVAAALGKHALEQDWDAPGFAAFAKTNSEAVAALMPAELADMSGHLGHPKHGTASGHSGHTAGHNTGPAAGSGKIQPVPVFLGTAIAALILALLFLFRAPKSSAEPAPNPEPAPVVIEQPAPQPMPEPPAQVGIFDEKTGNFIYDSGNATEFKLPNGKLIQAGELSSEARIFQQLNDPAWSVSEDKTKGWITLDHVYFETGSSKLTAESQTQLLNLSSILTAFPDAEVKLGGYTDNKGDSTKNVSLSQKRAEAAMSELVKQGVADTRLKAEGYGPMHPRATNDTPEGMAQNRRVDIRVTKK